ncbi:MAG TPA: hypothetical protein VKT78_10025, partial [Fimbriimonadaceae bacterium]|nr:hypothetical protein [Fimbriimonadaceae bacterium]
TQLYANEAFTFDATGAKSGQFVDVSTVSGEVVQHARTDKLGRVFLDGGLAAGTYLMTSGSGKSRCVQQITVKPCPTDVSPMGPLRFTNCPSAVPTNLRPVFGGESFNPDASQMQALAGPHFGKQVPILAATAHEITLASPQAAGLPTGASPIWLTNTANHEIAESVPMYVYDLQGRLTQVRVPSGSETHLMLNLQPRNCPATVHVNILSGPVDFGGGRTSLDTPLHNGAVDIPIHSMPGATGPFNVGWNLGNVVFANAVITPFPKGVRDGSQDAWVGNTHSWHKGNCDYSETIVGGVITKSVVVEHCPTTGKVKQRRTEETTGDGGRVVIIENTGECAEHELTQHLFWRMTYDNNNKLVKNEVSQDGGKTYKETKN